MEIGMKNAWTGKKKQIGAHMLILILTPMIGLLLLFLVHLLPVSGMKEHVYWSLEMIEQEFEDEIVVDGYPSTMTGNFTDCLMLQYAIYDRGEHSVLEQTLRIFRGEAYVATDAGDDGWWPGHSLVGYLQGVEQREVEYPRYWHGYLVVLKPLLLITSFNSIRLLNSALQLLLVGYIVLMLSKRATYSTAMAYLLSLPFMFYVSTYASLSLSVCFYVMNLAVLFQLRWEQQLFEGNGYGIFFLVVGICTSYFDLLTYPIITLVYPLCLFFVFHKNKMKWNLSKMLLYSIEWVTGYICMWASKWLLTDMLLGGGIMKDALSTVQMRTQSTENASRLGGFLHVIALQMQPYFNWCYVILVLLFLLLFVTKIFRIGLSVIVKRLCTGGIFAVIALYPFAWLFVVQNHSAEHWQFTCRILSATVFAGSIALNTVIEGCTGGQIADDVT